MQFEIAWYINQQLICDTYSLSKKYQAIVCKKSIKSLKHRQRCVSCELLSTRRHLDCISYMERELIAISMNESVYLFIFLCACFRDGEWEPSKL